MRLLVHLLLGALLLGVIARAEAGAVEGRLAELVELAAASGLAQAELRALEIRESIDADGLLVSVEPSPGTGVSSIDRAAITALGGQIQDESASLLGVRLPIDRVVALAQVPGVARVRLPYWAAAAGGLGPTVSEATELVGAGALQAEGVTGAGVRVAVIDLSFGSFSTAQQLGEIPADAVTLNLGYRGFEDGSTHGTAIAETLLDVAPGVALHALRIDTLIDLQQAAEYVRQQGIPIVNLSVAFSGTSYYDDSGPVSQVVNASHDEDGVFWAVASGNWAEKHWRGGLDGGPLEFAPADSRLGLLGSASSICVDLSWDQYGLAEKTDLDLFVLDREQAVVASSTATQGTYSDPFERACYAYDWARAPYELEVVHVAGPAAADVTLMSLDSTLEHAVASSSQLDPAVAHGAFAVGAVHADDWSDVPALPRGFSSRGPTNDGRGKPEIVAPDGISSSSGSGHNGTSYASPVVAGGAALLLEQDPTLTALGLAGELAAAAEDEGAPGRDDVYGYGLLRLPLLAVWDSDGDAVANLDDNCSHVVNPGQSDVGGLASAQPDGIGDACQCGDTNASGIVDAADVATLRQFLTGLSPLPAVELCNVADAQPAGVAACDVLDAVILRRALAALPPAALQICAATSP